jgi:lysophospholipase L1-like esterase
VRTILCYGDSNTWGSDPETGERFPEDVRWPGVVATLTDMAQMFEGAEEKSRQFSGHYERFAEQHGCEFFDASQVIVSSDVDGIHLDAPEHRKLGEAVAARLGVIFR